MSSLPARVNLQSDPLSAFLIWDPCICNLYNLCQAGSNYTLQLHASNLTNVHLISLNKQQDHTSFCYSLLLGQCQLKLFYCRKGRQNFASNVTLYPCERSRQNHLELSLSFNFHSPEINFLINCSDILFAAKAVLRRDLCWLTQSPVSVHLLHLSNTTSRHRRLR